MKTSTLICFVLFSLFVVSTIQQSCSGTCTNQNDCTDPDCPRCVSGQCQPGLPCYSNCSLNSDCDQSGDCTICRIGICEANGECGDVCRSADDCYGSYCKDCINGICASNCGGTCGQSSDCTYANTTCVFCQEGICQEGGCASNCASDNDCAGQGNCTTCSYNKCYSACNKACTTDGECNDAYTGCGLCISGLCQPGNVCGDSCANNNDCVGSCTKCTNGQCVTGVPCGFGCSVDTDCQQGPTSCSACKSGICSAP